MDLLRMVVKKRSEDKTASKDGESMGRFASRVAKLRGEGPLSSSDEPEVTLEVVSINIKDIEVPPNYVRKSLGNISSLVESIKTYGIQQPLKVVKIKGTRKYRLVFGRRRLKAAEMAGLDAVPCIVELSTREDRLQMLCLAENMQRNSLSLLEEGELCQLLLSQNTALDELVRCSGITPDVIKEMIKLLELPPAIRQEILNCPELFPLALIKALMLAYHQSKVNGKKLLTAIQAKEISTAAEAEAYLAKISRT